MKILITDSFSRKAFDVYNVAKRYYSKPDIIIASDGSKSICTIIYLKKTFNLSSLSFEEFSNDLLEISNLFIEEDIVFLPVEEKKILFFYDFIEKYGELNFKYSLPPRDFFITSQNKFLLNNFCINENIPSPKLFKNLDSISSDNFIPIIVKPRIGSGSVGIHKINKYDDLKSVKELQVSDYVIQELLPNGKDVQAGFFLCKNGNIVNSYCHKRIRTYPITGGVSVLSEVINNDEIIDSGKKIIRELNWSGLMMIEFLWDPKDELYKIIEINPRMWGSFLLSEFAETSFLSNYVNISLQKDTNNSTLRLNRKIRWIVFDFIHLIKSKSGIVNFWKISKEDTCYINMTYANVWSVFFFHLFFYLNFKNFLRFLKK